MPESILDMTAVGLRLRARRTALGRKIADVAEEAGVSMPYLANLERGRGNPTLDVMTRVARAIGADLGEILGTQVQDNGVDIALASLPRSLRDFSRSDEFVRRNRQLALQQGLSEDDMRAKLLAGMSLSPRRSQGDPTITDWRRLLDTYSNILG